MYKIGLSNIYANLDGSDTEMFTMIYRSMCKRKLPKEREPKGNAKDGAYCPKTKAGQSWAHIDKSKEEDKDEALSNNTED